MNNLELEYVYTDKDEIVVKSYNNYFRGITRNYMIVYKFKYEFDVDDLFIFDEIICNDDNEEKINDDLEILIKDKRYLTLNSNFTIVKNQVMQDLKESGVIDKFKKEIDDEETKLEKEKFMYSDKCYEDEYKTYIFNGDDKVDVSFSYHTGWGKNWNSFKWSLDLTSVDSTFLDDKMLSQILYITMMLNEYGKKYFEKTK